MKTLMQTATSFALTIGVLALAEILCAWAVLLWLRVIREWGGGAESSGQNDGEGRR
jgi:hypothetical protein